MLNHGQGVTRSRHKSPRRLCRPTSPLGRSDRPLALLLSFLFACSPVAKKSLTLLSRLAPRAGLVTQRQTFVRRRHCRWRCGSPASGAICDAGAVARTCWRRPRTHGRKRPRPLELGGEPGRGLSLQSVSTIGLSSLCMWERCWRRREPFSLSHIIGPIPLSRSDPLPGICSMTPEICSCEPSASALRTCRGRRRYVRV